MSSNAAECLVQEFLVESYENLDVVDANLLSIERGDATPETLAAVFRSVHTIKGTCGFLGLSKLESVAHNAENLLSLLRDGKIAPGPAITDALLRTVDAIRSILANLERDGDEGSASHDALVELLAALAAGRPGPPAQEAVLASAAEDAPSPAGAESGVPTSELLPFADEVATSKTNEAEALPKPANTSPVPPSRSAKESSPEPEATSRASVVDNTIRVDIGLLDRVMNLVGELVLTRNRILQFAPSMAEHGFANASQRLNLLTTELQEAVMKTRMQPIGNLWNKLPRMVRDLSHACGKRVELELDGNDTELDRTIIEAIKDPLTHAVRNAIDHGVETPEQRVAQGKPPVARLLLRAYHEGGQVNIEISDDGAGLNYDRIRQRALERGLVSSEKAAEMGERELGHLIFHPGFSTAAQVTNVSGRGVGMDVIKTNVERIGGSVDIGSVLGRGTSLKLKIPLTLAIIPALVVTSRGERFAIPQVNLHELVRIDRDERRGIERLYGATFYRLRGQLLPLVFLGDCLELPESEERAEAINIVVLQGDGRQFGLVVDSIRDTEEIVVKPLGKELRGLSVFAGATIMGDGHVALILDVLGLALRANLRSSGGSHSLDTATTTTTSATPQESFLLFSVGSGARMAIPLSLVSRLEEIRRDSVETSAGRAVVQYRGEILPLIDLAAAFGHRVDATRERLTVIVHACGTRHVGLVVDEILDTVTETITTRQSIRRPGTLGSAVIGGKVTDLLDVAGVLRRVDPDLLHDENAA